MPNDRLQRAVRALEEYFEKPSVDDVIGALTQSGGTSTAPVNTTAEALVMSNVISAVEGATTIRQILDELKSYGDDAAVNKFLTIYTDDNTLQPQNKMLDIVGSENSKNLSALLVNSVRLTPAARDIAAVTLFMNSIPTVEFSRCVPYLTIQVQSGRPPISADGHVQGLSLMRFLGGSFDVNDKAGDKRLAASLQGLNENSGAVTLSGMEMFTSPQTLVNPDPNLDVLRAAGVLDKFRPFMSIDKFEVELTPQVGFFAYRSANLDITLHDRSRLTEIADFVKPDLYSNTELLIEYGWSHPDALGINAFGDLINAMRSREKYGIVNSSFSFTKNGEVKIKLKLFTRGGSDMRIVKIGDGAETIAAAEAVRNLQKRIADLRLKLSQNNAKGIKEIRGEQELFSAAEDLSSSLVLSKPAREQLLRFLHKNFKGDDAKELKTALQELFGKNGRGGKASDLKAEVARVVEKRLRVIKDASQQSDPFLASARTALEDKRSGEPINVPTKGYVSFGRLMSMFIGVPLSKQLKYADVQLVFYPFNGNAAAARRLNISQFVISVSELERGLRSIAESRRGTQIPLRDFVQYIANNFIDDMSNATYGLKKLYRADLDPLTGVRRPPQATSQGLDDTQLFDKLQQRLEKLGVPDGVFKMPQVDIIIETLPIATIAEGRPRDAAYDKTLLRIHFIDRVASAYETLGQMILANREESLNKLGKQPQEGNNEHKEVYMKFLSDARAAGFIEYIQDDKEGRAPDAVDFNVDVTRLKSFLRRNIPTLTYGTQNTAIKEASFATIQEPLLSTVHMLRAGDAGPLSPQGLSNGNLPLRTLPSRATMTTAGCPLINYMQQFFVDFQTNTTIDNIYGVNKLTHEITQNKFETKIELVPLDSYGRYESLVDQVGVALQKLSKSENDKDAR